MFTWVKTGNLILWWHRKCLTTQPSSSGSTAPQREEYVCGAAKESLIWNRRGKKKKSSPFLTQWPLTSFAFSCLMKIIKLQLFAYGPFAFVLVKWHPTPSCGGRWKEAIILLYAHTKHSAATFAMWPHFIFIGMIAEWEKTLQCFEIKPCFINPSFLKHKMSFPSRGLLKKSLQRSRICWPFSSCSSIWLLSVSLPSQSRANSIEMGCTSKVFLLLKSSLKSTFFHSNLVISPGEIYLELISN